MSLRVALYVRQLLTDDPSLDDQLTNLRHAAETHSWEIVATHTDTGHPTPKRDRRPGLGALLQEVRSSRLDLIAVYSLHQLGRSVSDLVRILVELRANGVGLYAHGQELHLTADAALFGVADLLSGYDRAIVRERVLAGQRRAILAGVRIGRPPLPAGTLHRVRIALAEGRGIRETARLCRVGAASVHRIRQEMVGARSIREDA
jgi:DNA invertase Pin-like site-specific DNA recombinase